MGAGEGQGVGLLLADWAGALCPLPRPFLGPDSGVWVLPLLLGGSKDRSLHRGQLGSWGLPGAQQKRKGWHLWRG